MAAKNVVKLTFLGDTVSLERGLKQLGGESDKTQSKFGKLHTGAKVLAAGLLGGLAVAAKTGFDEFMDGQKATAAITASLKSAAHASDITASSIDDLSTSLMNKSGIDDEEIKHAAALALGFKNVRNSADVFNHVMQDATDISKKYGVSVDSAAKIAARALDNPVKGMQTLQKYGVSLTDTEKEHIKTLVQTGQTTQAQTILQDKLSQSVGGSATAYGKTLAGQLDIAKQTFNNLAGNVVGVVMPAFTAVVGVLGDVVGWLSKHQTVATILVGVLGTLAVAVLAVNTATKVWAASQAILNVALDANPIGLIITALAGLAIGLYEAWKHSETFRDIVKSAFGVVITPIRAVVSAVEAIISAVRTAYSAVSSFFDFFSRSNDAANRKFAAFVAQNQANGPANFNFRNSSIGNNADGGIVSGKQLSWVAEDGPEAIVPLTKPGRAMQVMRQAGLTSGRASGGNTYVTVNTGADPAQVVQAIRQYERSNGPTFARV